MADLALAFDLSPDDPNLGQVISARVASFIAELELPRTLREAGVADDQIDPLAAATAHELQGRDIASEADLRDLLAAAR